jgi:hypothetical protein
MRGHESLDVRPGIGRKWWRMPRLAGAAVAPAQSISRAVGARGRRRSCGLVALVLGIVFAGGVSAPAALAGTTFQRGDVLAAGPGAINWYGPDGTLKGTISSGGATANFAHPLCFDRSGTHLVAPGVGLFDSSGSALPSHWSSVALPIGECAVDGFGNVYVAGGPDGGRASTGQWGTIRKFDLTGNLLHSYTVNTAANGDSVYTFNLDVAPDQCTIFYNTDGGTAIQRFNVCRNTQEPSFLGSTQLDQLRVRANGQVLSDWDNGWDLFDPSGQLVSGRGGALDPIFQTQGVRSVSLDPDGTSVWIGGGGQSGCCFPGAPEMQNVARFDIATGQLLTRWSATFAGTAIDDGPSLAAYGPPLFGNANISHTVDSNHPGTAEAFVTRAGFSGQLTSLNLYLDPTSTATPVTVGVYADNHGHPGALQEQATITNPAAGSWNTVGVPSLSVTAGQRLWIAVLGPQGAGTVRFRDAVSGSGSETSAQHGLSALPATWSTGTTYADGRLSAYGS